MGSITAGTPVTVLRKNEKYSLIRDIRNREGWILNKELTNQQSSRKENPLLKAKIEELTLKLDSLDDSWKQRVSEMQRRTTQAEMQSSTLLEENIKLKREIDTIKNKNRNLETMLDANKQAIANNSEQIKIMRQNEDVADQKISLLTKKVDTKQDKLVAGENITISADNVISATGGGSGGNALGISTISFGVDDLLNSLDYGAEGNFYISLFECTPSRACLDEPASITFFNFMNYKLNFETFDIQDVVSISKLQIQ